MTGKPLSHTHHTRHDEAKQSLTDGGMEENRLYILNSTSHLHFPHLPISLSLFSLSPYFLVYLHQPSSNIPQPESHPDPVPRDSTWATTVRKAPISLEKQIADMTTTAREPSRTSRLDFIMNEVSGKAHSLLRQRDNSRTAILSARPSPFVYHKYAENQATINPYVGRQQS